jgi:hypothetical protein
MVALGGRRAGGRVAPVAPPRRARFTAYVFFSVMTVRALITLSWPLAAFALGAIGRSSCRRRGGRGLAHARQPLARMRA